MTFLFSFLFFLVFVIRFKLISVGIQMRNAESCTYFMLAAANTYLNGGWSTRLKAV